MLAIIRGRGEDVANPTPPEREREDGRTQRRKKHSARQRLQRKAFAESSKKKRKDRSIIIGLITRSGRRGPRWHSLLTAVFHFLLPHPVLTERGGGVRGLNICIAWEWSDISQPFDFKFSFLVWQSFFESFRRREWLTDRRCAPSTYLNSEPLSV